MAAAPLDPGIRANGKLFPAAGFNTMGELTDTPSAERTQLYEALADGRPGWARLMKEMLDAKAPPT